MGDNDDEARDTSHDLNLDDFKYSWRNSDKEDPLISEEDEGAVVHDIDENIIRARVSSDLDIIVQEVRLANVK